MTVARSASREKLDDFSTIGFLAVLSVICFTAPHSALIRWNDVLSFGWLALTASGSMAVRWPFTMGMARRQVPQEIWASPDFLRTHMVITRIWALSFASLAVALSVVRTAELGIAVGLPVRLAGLLIPLALTWREIRKIRARQAAS